MKKIIIMCGILLSCFSDEDKSHQIEQNKKEELNDNLEQASYIFYLKDTKTDLCFAAKNLRSYSALLTNVPCTPEVEKIAHSFTSGK